MHILLTLACLVLAASVELSAGHDVAGLFRQLAAWGKEELERMKTDTETAREADDEREQVLNSDFLSTLSVH